MGTMYCQHTSILARHKVSLVSKSVSETLKQPCSGYQLCTTVPKACTPALLPLPRALWCQVDVSWCVSVQCQFTKERCRASVSWATKYRRQSRSKHINLSNFIGQVGDLSDSFRKLLKSKVSLLQKLFESPAMSSKNGMICRNMQMTSVRTVEDRIGYLIEYCTYWVPTEYLLPLALLATCCLSCKIGSEDNRWDSHRPPKGENASQPLHCASNIRIIRPQLYPTLTQATPDHPLTAGSTSRACCPRPRCWWHTWSPCASSCKELQADCRIRKGSWVQSVMTVQQNK